MTGRRKIWQRVSCAILAFGILAGAMPLCAMAQETSAATEAPAIEMETGSEAASVPKPTASASAAPTQTASAVPTPMQSPEALQPEATQTPTGTPVPTESAASTLPAPVQGSKEIKGSCTDSGVTVSVDAPAGAFAAGTTLTISPVTVSAQQAPDDATATTVAFDITFTDPDGNEVQPDPAFPVAVTFSLPQEMVQADAVEAFHMENETAAPEAITPENVDLADGELTVEGTCFSIYGVTATSYQGSSLLLTSSCVKLDLAQGKNTATVKANQPGTKDVCYTWSIESGSNVITLDKTSGDTVTITGTAAGTAKIKVCASWKKLNKKTDSNEHYLYVRVCGENSTANAAVPSHHKTISANGNDSYTLTLDAGGKAGSLEQKVRMDFVFVLDTSGSMGGELSTRLEQAKKAIQNFVTTLQGDAYANNIDPQYALVCFSGDKPLLDSYDLAYSDARLVSNGWIDGSQMPGALENLNADGGTNYMAGLLEAEQILNADKSDATKVVMFLSDGGPTFYYDKNGKTAGAGNADADGYDRHGNLIEKGSCSGAATDEIKNLAGLVDRFYSVGVDLAAESDAEKSMQSLVATMQAKNASVQGSYVGTTGQGLSAALGNILKESTSLYCKNVVISDALSDYAVYAGNASLFVKNADGVAQQVKSKDYTLTLYDAAGNAISNVQDYAKVRRVEAKLGANLTFSGETTYQLVFKVKPSAKAYQEYAEKGAYPHTGDALTGATSAAKKGFYSNNASIDKTYLQYDVVTQKGTPISCKNKVSYSRPVLQVSAGTLCLKKHLDGIAIDEKDPSITQHAFAFTITTNAPVDPQTKYLVGSTGETVSFTKNKEGNFVATVSLTGNDEKTITGLPYGTYTVTENPETTSMGDSYAFEADTSTKTVTVNVCDKAATACFTNCYKPGKINLCFTKNWVGDVAVDAITYTLQRKAGMGNYVDFQNNTVTLTKQNGWKAEQDFAARDANCKEYQYKIRAESVTIDGKIYSSKTESGVTTLKFTAAQTGYEYAVVFTGAATKNLSAKNTQLECGEYTICKVDALTGTKLAGAVFGFYTDEACTKLFKETAPTGTDGLTSIKGLKPTNTYYFKETAAPSGYTANPTVYTVKVSSTGDKVIVSPTVCDAACETCGETDRSGGGQETTCRLLAVVKDQPVYNVCLTLQKAWDTKGNTIKPVGVTMNLYATSDGGTVYYVKQADGTVKASATKAYYQQVENVGTTALKVEGLPGTLGGKTVSWTVEENGVDAAGKVTLGGLAYQAVMSHEDSAWKCTNTLCAENLTVVKTFASMTQQQVSSLFPNFWGRLTNNTSTDVLLLKLSGNTGKVSLAVTQKDGNTIYTWTVKDAIPAAQYTVTEENYTNPGYVWTGKSTTATGTTKCGPALKNSYCQILGCLCVNKVDAAAPSGATLPGAAFTLKQGDKVIAVKVTGDSNGDGVYDGKDTGKAGPVCFDKLPIGTYTLQETAAPAGYTADATVYTVVVAAPAADAAEPAKATVTVFVKQAKADNYANGLLTVKDTKIPTPTPTPCSTSTTTCPTNGTKTGDNTPFALFAGVATAGAALTAFALIRRKRGHGKQSQPEK